MIEVNKIYPGCLGPMEKKDCYGFAGGCSMNYQEFIKSKVAVSGFFGFEVDQSGINPILKPHQKDSVQWAIKGGCRAIFASYGLGKSIMQLELLRLIHARHGGCQLIIAPLGVRQEFKNDFELLKTGNSPEISDSQRIELKQWMEALPFGRVVDKITFVRKTEEVKEDGLYITNYESVRDGKLDINLFNGVSLDEASILRSYGSKTFQTFLSIFKSVKYKFVATATPSPNRFKELLHYAGYLGIMDSGQGLTRFFKRDSTHANNLTLMPHMEKEFWIWVSSWALFLQYPSNLGYDDTGYKLPDLNINYHEVKAGNVRRVDRRDGQTLMFGDSTLSLADASLEKKNSIGNRIDEMIDIVKGYGEEQLIIWCDLDAEQKAIEKALKSINVSYVSLYGSTNIDSRETLINQWKNREKQVFVSKPMMYGSGINMQQCHIEIFLGINFKANDFLQAIHRVYRFLQSKACQIHIIYATSEIGILHVLKKKWKNHDKMVEKMTTLIKQYGLSNAEMMKELQRSIGVERLEVTGKNFIVANNDCVKEVKLIDTDSVGLVHTSIPFCYDEKTDVLTKDGWRSFEQVKFGNYEIATVSRSGLLEYQKPTSIVWEMYSGEMIHFSGRSFNLLVTPNHRMFVAKRIQKSFSFDQFKIVSAEGLTNEYESATRKSENSNGRILRGWKMCLVPPRATGEKPKKINIPPLPDHIRNGHGVHLYWVETKDFMELAGWYLSEGHADSFEKGRAGGRISIGQCVEKNNGFYKDIEELMVRIGLPPSLAKNQISVWCRNLAYFMQDQFGHGAKNKRIPRWVMDLHPSLLTILRDTMMKGDGSKRLSSYASISTQLRNDFQEICVKTGWRASLTKTKVINTGSTQIFPEIRSIPKRKQYSGMIGCATVPNGTMVVRRNGQTCVSGNSNHYEYTPSYNDFGFTTSNNHFWQQMDFLTPELLRIIEPGRIYACHTKDRINFGNVTGKGVPTVSPFHAECIFHTINHGFDYMGMVTVVTDVVRENNQTYRLGWTEQCKDGTKMGVGSPEYVLIFRKPQTDRTKGYADVPVSKSKEEYTRAKWQIDAHAFWRSSGDRLLTSGDLGNMPTKEFIALFKEYQRNGVYDYESHVKIGETVDVTGRLPSTFMSIAPESHDPDVWTDINRMLTLNGKQARRKVALHLCPLQTDIVDRIITRYSNEGDLVFDPFSGLGTVPVRALKLGRKGRGVELNPGYFMDSVKYLEAEERAVHTPSLFEYIENERVSA